MTLVQHNMNALNAYNKLNANVAGLKKASEKLSSGYRINRAGDDAAGLAISEKMRSQIRGLNQAVRNSQDGINMIQTFEGAAQETHSILQRMKELASESANGTYDNATDRAAIQLEFDQLNDELNQIADTDFNGTVVLNGGEMADGLKQVDGEFNYGNKAGQVAEENAKLLADAQAEAQKNIDDAQKKFDSAKNAYDAVTGRDLCLGGEATQWNTVDDNTYTSEVADTLFSNAKATIDGAESTLKDAGVDSFNVEYSFDETDGWKVSKAWYVNDDGEEVEVDLTTTGIVDANITTTENGGFYVASDNTKTDSKLGNAIFAGSGAKTGDVVTLTYTNTASRSMAPTNIGMDEESLKNSAGISDPKIELDAGITDEAIAKDSTLAEALKKLDQATVEFLYSNDGVTGSISDSDLILAEGDEAGTFTVSYKNADGKEIKLATITMDAPSPKSTATPAATSKDYTNNGGAQAAGSISATYDAEQDKWLKDDGTELADADILGGLGKVTDFLPAAGAVNGDKITLSWEANAGGGLDATVNADYEQFAGTVGKVSFGIALDEGNYDVSTDGPTIDAAISPDGVDSRAIDKAYEDAKAALADAKAAYPKGVEDLPDGSGVTKADAFDNSTARMTYTDHIVLQTGSRTKDAVDFTFKYNVDDTADMGDLKANLNISSRADGLNTANLSLADQDSANYAIDQIDKAINKVSMVRATFGSIQNRLEHKITNLTTTSENLQEAESSIRDTDMASEMMNYTKFNILQQAAQSMLAQANQQPQSILQLLG